MVHMNIWTNGFLFDSINKDMKCSMGQMMLRIHITNDCSNLIWINSYYFFPFFLCHFKLFFLFGGGGSLFYCYVRLMRIECSNDFEVLAFFLLAKLIRCHSEWILDIGQTSTIYTKKLCHILNEFDDGTLGNSYEIRDLIQATKEKTH